MAETKPADFEAADSEQGEDPPADDMDASEGSCMYGDEVEDLVDWDGDEGLYDGSLPSSTSSFKERVKDSTKKVWSPEDIQAKQQLLVEEIQERFCLSHDEVTALLRHHGWNASQAMERWLEREGELRRELGLRESQEPCSSPCFLCILDGSEDTGEVFYLKCGHGLCAGHWTDFARSSVADMECLKLRCPAHGCTCAVGDTLLLRFLDAPGAAKLRRFAVQSFIPLAGYRATKWCPQADCQNAVEVEMPRMRSSGRRSGRLMPSISEVRATAHGIGSSGASGGGIPGSASGSSKMEEDGGGTSEGTAPWGTSGDNKGKREVQEGEVAMEGGASGETNDAVDKGKREVDKGKREVQEGGGVKKSPSLSKSTSAKLVPGNLIGKLSTNVKCTCGLAFCWTCLEEVHSPVDCSIAWRWNQRHTSDSENRLWLLANSKPCPKCRRPIEKNHGCMHMTCTPPCKHEFCWLCLGDYSTHGESTGGFYACNRYQEARARGEVNEAEELQQRAKAAHERYMFYWERWREYGESLKRAEKSLTEVREQKATLLRSRLKVDAIEVDFLRLAWEFVMECCSILRWTFALGFYLPTRTVADKMVKDLFDNYQGSAESAFNRLHSMVEEGLEVFLRPEDEYSEDFESDAEMKKAFAEAKAALMNQVTLTQRYFDKLVSEVECELKNIGVEVRKALDESGQAGDAIYNPGTGTTEEPESWACQACTLRNSMDRTVCEACEAPRREDDE